MVNIAREPRAYELMTVITPELADEDLTNQIRKISSHVTDATGAIKETLTDSPWGRRRLAYSVRHNGQDYRDGYYIVFHFNLEPSRMTEIERELKLDVNVMRYLLVHDDPKAGEKDTGQRGDANPDGAAPTSTPVAAEEPVATAPVTDEPVVAEVAPEADQEATDAPAPVAEEPVAAEVAPDADQEATNAPAPVAEEPIDEALAVEEPAAPIADAPEEPETPGETASDSDSDATSENAKQEG